MPYPSAGAGNIRLKTRLQPLPPENSLTGGEDQEVINECSCRTWQTQAVGYAEGGQEKPLCGVSDQGSQPSEWGVLGPSEYAQSSNWGKDGVKEGAGCTGLWKNLEAKDT